MYPFAAYYPAVNGCCVRIKKYDSAKITMQEKRDMVDWFTESEASNTIADQELVTHAIKDKQAFAAIIRRYENPLLRYINRLGCKDSFMAKDLLQEIFIKIYIHLNDYDPCFPFSSWIYRIAHNEIVSFFRKEKRRSIVLNHNELVSLSQQITDGNEEVAHDNQIYTDADIQIALDRLDQKYRDVLLLRFFEVKSYEEISDILLIPQGTVATLINRAKKKIKASLSQKHCS